MGKVQETVLEIDLSALAHNYRLLRGRIREKTKLLAVVKAFAYGSDAVKVAQKLEALGVDYLAVAYVSEGTVLRDAGIRTPILVLHPQIANFDKIIEKCLEPSLYSERVLKAFLATAEKHGQKQYPIHLKFNTGLNRLGFSEAEIPLIAKEMKNNRAVKAIAVFSHLAASEDDGERSFTQQQLNRFEGIAAKIDLEIGYRPFRHVLNTSGILNYPQAQFHMVRSGIGLYGFGNDAKVDAQLRPIASLKTIISQIHTLKAGESVGYNRAFIAGENCKIATLPLGHADGIGRIYGGGTTQVLLHDTAVYIVGNVCMDMIMIDVTEIDCSEGDEVTVFGNGITATTFAETAHTISYELLTGISQRVTRRFIGD